MGRGYSAVPSWKDPKGKPLQRPLVPTANTPQYRIRTNKASFYQ